MGGSCTGCQKLVHALWVQSCRPDDNRVAWVPDSHQGGRGYPSFHPFDPGRLFSPPSLLPQAAGAVTGLAHGTSEATHDVIKSARLYLTSSMQAGRQLFKPPG